MAIQGTAFPGFLQRQKKPMLLLGEMSHLFLMHVNSVPLISEKNPSEVSRFINDNTSKLKTSVVVYVNKCIIKYYFLQVCFKHDLPRNICVQSFLVFDADV